MASAAGEPKPIVVPHSAWTGNDYQEHDDAARVQYIQGLVDGFLAAPFFGADSTLVEALHQCLVPMKIPQVAAIVEKYLAGHPEVWHDDMHALALQALRPACPGYSRMNNEYWSRRDSAHK
jgi:hypothetical protein